MRGKEYAFEEDVAELVEECLGHALDRGELGNTGIGNQDIDFSESFSALFEEALKIVKIADVVSRLRPKIVSFAPLFRNSRAVARPIPLLPPVITATLPSSFTVMSPFLARVVVP